MIPMSDSRTLYDALRDTISEVTEADDTLSLPELIGTLELVKAELLAAALEPDEDDAE